MATARKAKSTKSPAKVNTQRRSQLEYFGKAAAAIAGMSLLPSLTSGAVNFRKTSGVQTLYLADNGSVGINTITPNASYKLDVNGWIRGTRVDGAVWNDIADFLETENEITVEFGKVYVLDNKGKTRLSKKRCEKGAIGIASDTYGMSVGKKGKGKKEIPIALAGIVLAHVDKAYVSGTPLVCTKAGKLTKANCFDRSYKIIATYYKLEKDKKWNGVVVNGRHWVKVK